MTKTPLQQEIYQIDLAYYGARHWDYAKRRIAIVEATHQEYGTKLYPELLKLLYEERKLSTYQIAELVLSKTQQAITPRSIERSLRKHGVSIRKIKEAFTLAIQQGRVKWAWREGRKMVQKKAISRKLRHEILKRDKYKCVLCGATAKTTVLEIDHIVARVNGGTNDVKNLRVLCYECNAGKRDFEKETNIAGGFVGVDTTTAVGS